MRWRLPERAGVWLLTAIGVAASGGFLAYRAAVPGDGAVASFYAAAWRADGVEVTVVAPIGELRDGDVVTAVAGRPLGAWVAGALDAGVDRSGVTGSEPIAYGLSRAREAVSVPVVLGAHDVTEVLLQNWSAVVFIVVLQLVAGYVLWRRPRVSAAAALAVAAVGVTGSTIPWFLGLQVSDIIRGWPFVLYALAAAGLYMLLWPAGAIHLPLAMASGPGGPGRRVLAVAYGIPLGAYGAALVAAAVLSPTATAWVGTWPTIQMAVVIPTILIGAGLSILGYRRATRDVRDQIWWMALGGLVSSIGGLCLFLVPELVTGRTIVPWSAIGLVALPMPLGVAVGILRRRLFDIEVVVNRALVYGGATVAIVAIYVVTVTVLGAFLTVQGGFSASLLATAVAAVVALPIRDVLQRGVNRLMYGDREEPYRALSRLGAQLEAAIDPIEAPAVIVRTIAESLRVPWVGLRLGGPASHGTSRTIAYGRAPAGEPLAVPLVYGAEAVADLLVAPRSPSEPLSAADLRLLDALARQAGPAVHAARLTLDLVASRERLIVAREEERRRIRRDLHDGLGPTLAAIGLRAEAAADLAPGDPQAAERLLTELREDVDRAIGDVRRLVDGLRPPALDQLGLVGALEAEAARLAPGAVLQVERATPLPDMPAAVEVAAYRIAVEAMTNAARHAGARACRVRVAATDGGSYGPALEIEVVDDGQGLPEAVRPGIGLGSMRERAAEVGGTCVIEPRAGGGVRVHATLPLGLAASGSFA